MFLSDIGALGDLGAGLSLSGFYFPVKFSIPGAAGGWHGGPRSVDLPDKHLGISLQVIKRLAFGGEPVQTNFAEPLF